MLGECACVQEVTASGGAKRGGDGTPWKAVTPPVKKRGEELHP